MCLVYQKAFAKEPQDGCLGTQDSLSELPLESLMLLELLLREFINCELHGQQGVAVGVGYVRVEREVWFVFVDKQ